MPLGSQYYLDVYGSDEEEVIDKILTAVAYQFLECSHETDGDINSPRWIVETVEVVLGSDRLADVTAGLLVHIF